MKTVRVSIVLAAAATCTAMLALGGCYKPADDSTYFFDLTKNPTPELQGTVERRIDVYRHLAITHDLNKRMFSDDLGRMLYTDQPSRLSPLPIHSTSGMPR